MAMIESAKRQGRFEWESNFENREKCAKAVFVFHQAWAYWEA